MRKRNLLFTLFMTMLMMLLCPQRMWADWTYDATAGTITDGTTTLNKITCNGTELTIGDNLNKTFGDLDFSLPVKDSGGNTYTITVISNSAFYNCTFNSLKLPNELTTIGVSAFCFHTVNNGSITIPASVTSIGESAFGGSRNLDSFVVESGNANYCVYDGMLYDINKEILMACPKSKSGSVELPNTVKTIQKYAFYYSKITSITLPESLTTIGNYAFQTSSITSITIPKGVTSIGEEAFYDCSSLSAINVEEGNTSYCSLDGILYSYDKKTLIACPAGYPSTSVKIPDGVVTVQGEAFAYNKSLKSVEIPSSVINIGVEAFWYASSLATITCNVITPPTLDDYAFYHIASGAKVIVPETSADAYKAADGWSSMNIVARVSHTVTFNINGHGSAIAAQTVAPLGTVTAPADPTDEDYLFFGWYTDADCTNAYDFSTIVTDDITLYAKWEKGTSFTAVACGTYPSDWGWYEDQIISGYNCTVQYDGENYYVKGWDGVKGDDFYFVPDGNGAMSSLNGSTDTRVDIYMNHSTYYAQQNYIPYNYADGMGSDDGYIILYGYFYKTKNDYKWGTVSLFWGSNVTFFPSVTLNTAGYATYSSPVDVKITTDGVNAYYATVSGDEITLHELEGDIPAGVGVILYGTAGTKVEFSAATSVATNITDNALQATTTKKVACVSMPSTGTVWALGVSDEFMRYTGKSFIDNRAYLVHELVSGAKMHFVFADETDGINSIENGELEIENDAAYNVAGQRVKNNAKGIVIKNGQKYFNK